MTNTTTINLVEKPEGEKGYTEFNVRGNHPVYSPPTFKSMPFSIAQKYAAELKNSGYKDIKIEGVR